MLEQFVHNGVIVPKPSDLPGLFIVVQGEEIELTPKQEEMALAWARKKDTKYVQDEVFVRNFFEDFSKALGVEPPLTPEEVDFTAYYAYLEAQQEAKEEMSKEERKADREARKAERERLKAKYGYAIVDGQRVELGTYMVEPSSIFVGRGKHPLRGRWKEGAERSDITLNLSPDASLDRDGWDEIVWQPDSMWVARWKDKLSGKLKYVWLGDTAPIKQEREAEKFDKGRRLGRKLGEVREQISGDLTSDDAQRRMVATACYLIDHLCLRAGDEKDADEADTVGATTLRPEHVTFHEEDRIVEFNFLGKDAVEWHRELEAPEDVWANLVELVESAQPSHSPAEGGGGHPVRNLPQLFHDIDSRDVNAYLSAILPGLTAKVFRTYHATAAVRKHLAASDVKPEDPEHVKWKVASEANLEAARLCNHTKEYQGDWEKARERYESRRERAEERIARYEEQVAEREERLAALEKEVAEEEAEAETPEAQKEIRERYVERLDKAHERIEASRERLERARVALDKIDTQFMIRKQKRDWNTGTSLKSYIDPRVYYRWGEKVDYDVLNAYYPAKLRRNFAWVRTAAYGDYDEFEEEHGITLRTCMHADLRSVAEFLDEVAERYPDADLPLDPEEIADRYLPSLYEEWREAFIVLDNDEKIIAFVAVGPVWNSNGAELLDVFGVVASEWDRADFAGLLEAEVRRRTQFYKVQHPKKDFALCPCDESCLEHARALRAALDIVKAPQEGEVSEGKGDSEE
ncbi:MAG: DNA topoisomerase I [Anaerolineales bacterium]